MAGIAGLLTAIPGLALPIAANAAGIGKNDTRAKTFAESGQYDANRFEYGGQPGLAGQTANRFAYGAQAAQMRQAPQANYGRANDWDAQSQYARQSQGNVAGLLMNRATGATPSIAGQQAALDMQRATAAQSSAAAGARGAAGLALAGQNAANNTATMQSAISNQAQINAANERMQAEQAAFGAFSGMRGGDQASQGLAAQQAQYNAGLQAQQRAQNDAYSMGLYGQEANVRNAQLTANMNQQGLMAGSHGQATGLNVGISQNNANREFDYYKQFSGSAQGAADAGTAMGLGGGGGQPNTGLAAPSPTGLGSAGGAQTGMVGIPQPGTTSDDRAKFGISPLGLLGFGGGGSSSPGGTVDIGSKGYMSASDIQQASTGLAGGGGGMPGMVGGGGVTGGNVGDLGMPGGGGGMSGGLLSDDKAKLRAVYLQGIADGQGDERSYPGLAGNEQLIVGRDGARIQAGFAGARTAGGGMTDRELAARASEDRATAPLSARDAFLSPVPAVIQGGAGLVDMARAQAERHAGLGVDRQMAGSGTMRGRDQYDPTDVGAGQRYASTDPVTQQFAQGLAPIQFEYKPGMGPPGRQTGVRAQQAETQPLTASMITRRPDGLRQIDPAMGLGTALAGVGHLAQKQQRQQAQLDELLGLAARREGY